MSNIERRAEGSEELVRALALLSILPFAPTITPATLVAWGTVLDDAGIKPAEIVEGARRLARMSKRFPAPVELIESCREIRLVNAKSDALPTQSGPPITREERDAILNSLKHREFALEVIEGRGAARRYRIEPEDVIITDEDLAKRDEQVRRLRGEA